MASKALPHGRSLSLPSNTHPFISQFDDTLARTKSSDNPTSSSLSTIENKLNGLKNLYSNIDDLLMFTHIQQIISQECEEKWVDQALDGLVRLLDSCITAKDIVSQTKHNVQQLFSALRRKDHVNGIHSYQISRKQLKKMIQKSLKDLRSLVKTHKVVCLEKDDEKMALAHMLQESESVTITTLESLFSYVMGSKGRKIGWSLVSKKETDNLNEFNKVDSFLQLSQDNDAQLLNQLKEMESSMAIVEEEIECLFKQLIKTRVFLLNILNH